MTAAEKLPCELILSSGHAVLLDPDDYVWASRWSWQAHSSSLKRLGQVYAFRATRKPDGRRSGEFLHRVIMGAGPGQVVDHVSGDTLDCRRGNLRITDRRGNAQNVRSSKGGGSKTWREVLGLDGPGPRTVEQVEAAYRRLARERHPDAGGSHEATLELNAAREDALREAPRG